MHPTAFWDVWMGFLSAWYQIILEGMSHWAIFVGRTKKCMKSILLLMLLLGTGMALYAQKGVTVSGTIRSAATGEDIIGANVLVAQMPGTGAVANVYGFYSLTLPQGGYTLQVRCIGFVSQNFTLDLRRDTVLNVSLAEASQSLTEVRVVSEKDDRQITESQIGMTKINMAEINKLPVIFGERDVLKSIQLLPGVKSTGEGRSGFSVRGGSTDQNLILLDEATVYNASHLLGFFSTFNSDAIKDVTLYKGSAPAQFGGRASSVLDVRMNEGDKNTYRISGGLGLIASHLNVEGPIQKGKSSFLVTGRRTYADLFLKLAPDEGLRNNQLYFYDLNAKTNFELGAKDRLYVSGYYGKDVLGLGDNFRLDWGNGTGTLRWNHLINPKTFSNTSFIFSDYQTNTRIESGNTQFKVRSEIMDFNLKQEFQVFPNPRHSIKVGYQTTYHVLTPGEVDASETAEFSPKGMNKRHSWENALYAGDDWGITERIKMNYGVRLVSFSALSGDYYTLDAAGNVTDTLTQTGFGKTYFNAEPRVSFNFMVAKATSLKVGYARNTQFIHLLSNATSENPVDKWVPSSNNIKPQISDQVSLGVFQNVYNNMFEFSLEGYYKYMANQIDYRDGADVLNNELYESQLLYGVGRAYGVEFLVKKTKGKCTGWVGYTYSRTEKLINGINNGNWYPAKQDKTHDLSVVLMYQPISKITLSAVFVYSTGNAVTFPSGKYEIDGTVHYVYTERNGYRMPDNHRLDVNITIDLLKKRPPTDTKRRLVTSDLSIGCYNVYGRQNAYSITFRQSETDPQKTEAVQTSLFRWVPSVAWNFKF